MKTKQEQIEKIQEIINDCYVVDSYIAAEGSEGGYIDTEEAAKALMQAGYGDVSEYKAEIEQLNEKLAKQTRIARDANAKFTGVEHYLRPFQYKADRLQTKCNDLKRLSDWQREEIKRLKAEVNKGCDDCETIKQAQIDVLKRVKVLIFQKDNPYNVPFEEFVNANVFCGYIDELIKEIEKQ